MSKTIRSILEELVSNFADKEDDGYWGFDTNLGSMESEFNQALAEIEEVILEARIEELRYHSLFYSGRKYSDKTDWKHEVELIELMNDNRILELTEYQIGEMLKKNGLITKLKN